jgi:hypothetical protein
VVLAGALAKALAGALISNMVRSEEAEKQGQGEKHEVSGKQNNNAC